MGAPAKTYGRVVRRDGTWGIRAVPHVTVILKRLFIRADHSTPGVLIFRDTPEVARDLEWFTERWPLEGDPDTLAYLKQRADEHRATEEAVFTLLSGYRRPDAWREPARKPRDYQLIAADLVHVTGRVLLGDELGLGKSFSAYLVLRNPDALPALVVCKAHLCTQWLRELEISLPWLRGHITAKRDPYDLAGRCGGQQPDVVITSYPKFPYWADHLAGNVATVIYDEIQELRRGADTAKGRAAIHVSAKAAYRAGLSATPVHNYGGEIWEVVQPLDPDALGTKSEFTREWCGASRGLANHAIVRDPAALGEYLRGTGLMLRRTRKDLHMELPEPIQIEQPVDTNHEAIDLVAADLVHQAKMLLGEAESTSQDRWHAASEVDWKLRRATGLAKAPYVAAFVKLLLESEQRVVLWGWHRDCFAPGTKVLMYDGTTKNVEDVQPGDRVMGPDSQPRTVKSLAQGHGKLYRVVPNKGEPWVCSENHILTVRNERADRIEKLTAREFAEWSPRWQRGRQLYRAGTTHFSSQPVIEPWFMGFWLGDGAASLKDLRVSSADPEVEMEIGRIAERHGLLVRKWASPGATGTSRTKQLCLSSGILGCKSHNRLIQHFRALGLHNNKRIPHSYATASVEDRRQLLAGLIDSDGHVFAGNAIGTADFTTNCPFLAADAAFVARSLGLAAYIKTKIKSRSGYGPAGSYLSVSISGDLTQLPMRIARKRPGVRAGHKDVLRTGFTVEQAGAGEYYGFEVDGDRLFLLADFTVVHNCYDIWLDQLKEHKPLLYTGSETPAQKARNAAAFMNGASRVLIMSLVSGAGLDGLQKCCSVGVFGELDWSPEQHAQCVGRLARDGQENTVVAYFMTSDDGTDPHMAEVLGLKRAQSVPIRDPQAELFQAITPETDRARLLAADVLKRIATRKGPRR